MKPILFVRGSVGGYHPLPQDSILDANIAAQQYMEDGYDVYICYGEKAVTSTNLRKAIHHGMRGARYAATHGTC